jgi:DNA polymerase-3 subunit alpha
MQIARSLAGYSLGQADLLRRAMGKKDDKEMARQKDQFLAGAQAQQIDPRKAEAIFDLMAKFAEYGFNKSHSAAYALIAYQTAYLKAHYPVEFMAALLSCDMDSTDKVLKNISDCREQGIEVLPPDINRSGQSFTVVGNSMRFGLGAVKGVGGGAIESILEARQDGPFTDLYDFCERVDLRRVNRKVLEALVKCGAFDSLHQFRAPLIAALDDAVAAGQRFQEERNSAQVSLFGDLPETTGGTKTVRKLPVVDEWLDKEKLGYEKEALGFLITGHPLDRYVHDIKRFASAEITRLTDLPENSEVRVCGIVTSLKEITTKKGDRMGFVTIEDLTGQIEITVFSDMYIQFNHLLKCDDPLLITGKLEKGEKGCKLLVMKPQEGNGRKFPGQVSVNGDIKLLAEAQEQQTTRISLTLRLPELTNEKLAPIRQLLENHPGTLPVQLLLEIPARSQTVIKLPEHLKVAASDEFRLAVERCVGYNAAIFE